MYLTIPEMLSQDKGISTIIYTRGFISKFSYENSHVQVITPAIARIFTEQPIGRSLSKVKMTLKFFWRISKRYANVQFEWIGIALDPVQQKRMAHSSWSVEHQEDEEMDERDEFPLTTTTTVSIGRQTDRVQLMERVSTTEATTRKTVEANYQSTQEPTKRNNGPLVQQQQQQEEDQQKKRKTSSSSSAMPTSLTSKASAISQGISSSHHLFLLLFFIFILIDNFPPFSYLPLLLLL